METNEKTAQNVIHLMGGHQVLTLFLILLCAYRQEPTRAVFQEAKYAAD